jgi:iron complex transport system ATP-binding protein
MGHLTLRDVRIEIGGRTLLERISFEAAPGECVALVGANGVGKTTLLRAISGSIAPAAGSIALDGSAPFAMSPAERARRIAALGGELETPAGLTVREVALMGRFAHRPWWDWTWGELDAIAVDQALARVGLDGYAARNVESLSSGERRRVWLALALAQGAGLVLLDEPTTHLDLRVALEMLALLRKLAGGGTTFVVVLHDLNEAAQIADRVAVLGEGALLAYGPPEQVLERETIRRAFGIEVDIIDLEGIRRIVPRAVAERSASALRRSPGVD